MAVMKRCDRIAEIHEECWRLANVETGEKETLLGKKHQSWRKI